MPTRKITINFGKITDTLLRPSIMMPIVFFAVLTPVIIPNILEITDPNYKSPHEIANEEKDRVRQMSCGELKDYVLLAYDGEYHKNHQLSLAKNLHEWNCEK